jgi:hypothetical protein
MPTKPASPALTPFRVQKFLSGLRYPAPKEHALRHARELGADENVIHALSALPDGIYESPVSLSRACPTAPP